MSPDTVSGDGAIPEGTGGLITAPARAGAPLKKNNPNLPAFAAEVIEGYKSGMAGGPMEFISAAYDEGWNIGAKDRERALKTPEAP